MSGSVPEKAPKKFSIAVAAVVYPAAISYLGDFWSSLRNQTRRDFDVVFFNDGCSDELLAPPSGCEFTVRSVSVASTPGRVRQRGIEFMQHQGYEFIHFADVDDWFSPCRIERATRLLGDHDIVVNDLSLVDTNGRTLVPHYLSHRFTDRERVQVQSLEDKNFLGLSNTGIRGDMVSRLKVQEDMIAFDWFLFHRLLKTGSKAIFCAESETFYRQHDANTVGLKPLDEASVERGLQTKERHYFWMAQEFPEYLNLHERFFQTRTLFTSESAFRKKYLAFVLHQQTPFPLWWEDILPGEDL